MKCREVQEHLGDAIDRELPGELKAPFYEHLEKCPPCRDEYETETIGKHAVRRFIPRLAVPTRLYESIVRCLREGMMAEPVSTSRFSGLTGRRYVVGAVATGLALLALVLFLSGPRQAPQTPVAAADILGHIRQNFALLRSGNLKPAIVCTHPETVAGYFRERPLPFAVEILKQQKCDWYGATADEIAGVKRAHVLYKFGNDLMYVYQVGKRDAMEGTVLPMPHDARASLTSTGWYTDESPDCSIVMWTTGETLCAAASTMDKERVLQVLALR